MNTKIGYTEAQKKQTNKKRKRNILWFNPHGATQFQQMLLQNSCI